MVSRSCGSSLINPPIAPPSAPRTLPRGTRTSSKNSSDVSDDRCPSFSRFLPRRKPGRSVSTRTRLIPREPPSGAVRTTTITRSHICPFEMKVFWPEITNSSLVASWPPAYSYRRRLGSRVSALMDNGSERDLVSALEFQNLARLVGRRDVQSKSFDDLSGLRDLIGI